MKPKLIAAAVLLSLCGVASAHRLDEYLQATMLSVDRDRVQASMRLVPGVSIAPTVIAALDTNVDGVLSKSEQTAYAARVLSDLTLTIDGHPLHPVLASTDFPTIAQIEQGVGEIHIDFTADLPPGGEHRSLILESRNRFPKSVYLVNSLVPIDPAIQIVSQSRNEQQSFYRLDYTQTSTAAPANSANLANPNFSTLFHLGVRHIAEGTDHLLFLLALLLPAPLLAIGSRWSGIATVRGSVLRIVKVVTAFTVGHSVTLALAALGIVHVPSRPIEVLIAISILVSAIHALRPLFPGKEAGIAAFFGLIHGLAFASTLGELGLVKWQLVTGILAFNLGIETMQMVVVAVTMPSLVLLSRTRAYPAFRIAGALFACMASLAWIAERTLGIHTSVDLIVDSIADHAIWVASALFFASLLCWLSQSVLDPRATSPTRHLATK